MARVKRCPKCDARLTYYNGLWWCSAPAYGGCGWQDVGHAIAPPRTQAARQYEADPMHYEPSLGELGYD